MSIDYHFYEPSQGHGLPHDPFNAIIAPRPIGWISSQSETGILNLAPYSFFNAFNYKPPLIGFSSQGYKDSVANIERTGEFVWNLATRELAEEMNTSSAMVGPEVDEFALAGLEPAASTVVKVPRVARAQVAFECKLSQIVRLKTAAGDELDQWLVLGEVVAAHIVTGHSNYVLRVQARNLKQFSDFIVNRLNRANGVTDIRSEIILQTIKDGGGVLDLLVARK